MVLSSQVEKEAEHRRILVKAATSGDVPAQEELEREYQASRSTSTGWISLVSIAMLNPPSAGRYSVTLDLRFTSSFEFFNKAVTTL